MAADGMVEIVPHCRRVLEGLFSSQIGLRVMLDAILEGRFGEAEADSRRDPHIACLSLEPFAYFGGDSSHPLVDHLLTRLVGFRVIVVTGQEWRQKITSWRESKVVAVRRHTFSHAHLDPKHLDSLASRVPEGIDLQRIEAPLAERVAAEVSEDLMPDFVFASVADFLERGFGHCALANDQLVGGVTSAVLSDGATEIQINTNSAHRKMGIGTALGARFILECLERGIEPHWDTGDQVSYHLAEKLGYVAAASYEVLRCEE